MVKTEKLEDPPTSIDPYEVLEVSKTATEAEIKSAYKKLALKRHPDKAPSSERAGAHTAFQALALAYAVLSNTQRRARYDRTGSTEESIVDDAGFDWTEYYRTQFAEVVTMERIEEIKREYQGSEEEKQDVLKAYTRYRGDLDKLLETVLLSGVLEDEARFRAVIESAIEAGEVQAWDKFTKETEKTRENRRKRALKERKEAERAAASGSKSSEDGDQPSDNEPPKKSARIAKAKASAKANGKAKANGAAKPEPNAKAKAKAKGNSMNDLAALIQQRQAGRTATTNAFFDSLEAKYGDGAKDTKGKGKGKMRAADEPPEEAFAEMAKRARKGA